MTTETCRQEWDWYDYYRMALLGVLYCQDESLIVPLLGYVQTDLPRDGGAFKHCKASNDYYIQLGLREKHPRSKDVLKLQASIRSARGRRPKQMLAAQDALYQGDAAGFEKPLLQLLKDHLKKYYEYGHPWQSVSIEGSILYGLAVREGLDLPAIPDEMQKLVLQLL